MGGSDRSGNSSGSGSGSRSRSSSSDSERSRSVPTASRVALHPTIRFRRHDPEGPVRVASGQVGGRSDRAAHP
eukprot:9119786-Pyramimonas_sp.AAC.1